MTKPHHHCELIKAWADGAEIEWYDSYKNKWIVIKNPVWDERSIYRIKPPATIIKYRRYIYNSNNNFRIAIINYSGMNNLSQIKRQFEFVRWIDNDWIEEIV